MQRVLLTGANGFLGRNLGSILLNKEVELYTTSHSASGLAKRSYPCDLLSVTQVKDMIEAVKPDVILHAAAFVPKKTKDYNSQISRTNVKMVENLLSVQDIKFVNISSMTVYGLSDEVVRTESDPVMPETAYGKSKAEIEELLFTKSSQSLTIRLPGLFGVERRSGLVYNVLKSLSQHQQPDLPKEPLLWAAMDVEHASQVISKALVKFAYESITINSLNVSYSEVYSINRFLQLCSSLFATTCTTNIDHPDFSFDLSRLKSLNIAPEVSLEEAIINLSRYHGFL